MKIDTQDIQTLLDSSPICNKLIDTNGKLQYMSSAGVKILKIKDINECYGQDFPPDFFSDQTRATLREALLKALNGESCTVETSANDTEGKELWFSASFVPVYENGNIKYVIGASVDISERIHAEAEIKKYQNQLEIRVEEKTKEKFLLQEQLLQSQKMEAVGNLASGVAHDFNNILEMIVLTAEHTRISLTQGEVSSEKILNCFDSIITATDRAKGLTRQMLGFARKGKYIPQNIDINILIGELVQLLNKGLASTKMYKLTKTVNAKKHIHGDSTQIHQVVQNLAINARDAMPEGGKISFGTEDVLLEQDADGEFSTIPAGEYVKISVSDSGCGIEPEIIDQIFDPFFTSKNIPGSSGLGLATVWGIVKNHEGYIQVRTKIGNGTTFDIYFPAVEPVIKKNNEPTFELKKNSGKVLVVDDEIEVLELCCESIEMFGYEAIAVSSAEEALAEYTKGDINLVLTDLLMQPIGGAELFEELIKLDPKAIVYIMSGYYMDARVQEVMDKGVKGFLEKPFKLDELEKIIHQGMSHHDQEVVST